MDTSTSHEASGKSDAKLKRIRKSLFHRSKADTSRPPAPSTTPNDAISLPSGAPSSKDNSLLTLSAKPIEDESSVGCDDAGNTLDSLNLWALAFKDFSRSNPDLANRFVSALSLGNSNRKLENTPSSDDALNLEPTRLNQDAFCTDSQTAEAAMSRIRDIIDAKDSHQGFSAKFRNRYEETVKIILSASSMVSAAVAFNPYAATAWTGVCLILPIFLNSSKENEAAIEGLNVVANLMAVYKWKERIYLRKDAAYDFSQATRKVYASILQYECSLLVHLQQHRMTRFKSNVLDAGHWNELVAKIKRLDLDCDARMKAVDNVRADVWRNEQREWQRILLQKIDNEQMRGNIRKLYSNYEEGKNVNPQRSPGTGEWFLRHPDFLLWRESRSSRCLWLSADPGFGKSVIARHLVENRDVMSMRDTKPVICYFFFRNGDSEKDNGKKALCAVLHQLCMQKPALYRFAEADFENKGDKVLDDFDALWAIFLEAVSDPDSEEVICVLDALDECEEGSRTKLMARIVDYYQNPAPVRSNVPSLKFLVTSRPITRIVRVLRVLTDQDPTTQVSGDQAYDSINQEIDLVVTERMKKIGKDLKMSHREEKALKARISAIPNRTYLWLHLVLDLIGNQEDTSPSRLSRILDDIPEEVDQAYNALLDQIPTHYIDEARKIFHLILAAARPLSLGEFNVVLSLDSIAYEPFFLRHLDEGSFKRLCGLFVTIVDSRVYLIHQTAADFLNRRTVSVPSKSWSGSFTPPENHHVLAKTCISFLMLGDCDDETLIKNFTLKFKGIYAFLEYAAVFWATHFALASSLLDNELVESVLINLYTNRRRFKIWSTIYNKSPSGRRLDCPSDASSTAWASYFGHEKVLKMLLKSVVDIDATDNCGRTALSYAAHEGRSEVVQLLLDKGAQPDVKDVLGSTPLSLAAEGGHSAVVKQLLQKDINISSSDAFGLTPLLYASNQNHEQTMELLKRRNDSHAGSPPEDSIGCESKEMVLLPVTELMQEYISDAFKSGLWVSRNDSEICHNTASVSATGLSELYNGVRSGLYWQQRGFEATARSNLIWAISHVKTIIETESPLALSHLMRVLATIGQSGLTSVASAFCKHTSRVAFTVQGETYLLGAIFFQLGLLFPMTQSEIYLVVTKGLEAIVTAFEEILGPYHMQTIYTMHIKSEISAMTQGPDSVTAELRTLAKDVESYQGLDSAQSIQVLIDLSQNHLDCRRFAEAEKAGQQIIDRASRLLSSPSGKNGKNLSMLCEGHRTVAESQTAQGNFEEAESHFKETIALFEPLSQRSSGSTLEKYRSAFADWLRARSRHEEAAEYISSDNSLDSEIQTAGSIYAALAQYNVEVDYIAEDYRSIRSSAVLQWPERLLHVKTMTSRQRGDGNTYGGDREPLYNILSYKWGLWVVQSGPSIEIEGVTWEIPAVDPMRWTVTELEQVIQYIAQDVEYVWIDVACVDQQQNQAIMAEIQREPQIFLRASKAFVWLVDFPSGDLEADLNTIAENSRDLPRITIQATDEESISVALQQNLKPLKKLLSSAWFRSHWTLREIIMRREAILLNREGQTIPIHHDGNVPAVLDILVHACASLLAWLKRIRRRIESTQLENAGSIGGTRWDSQLEDFMAQCLELIETSGPFFLYCSVPRSLRDVTEDLLRTGQQIVSREELYTGSHAHYQNACTCSNLREGKCLPCVMGVSYKIGDTVIDSKTMSVG